MIAADIDSVLRAAVDLHRQNRFIEADRLYAAVLAQDPDHPDALHLSGLTARHLGDPVLALARLTRAVEQQPNFVAALLNLGNFLASRGRPEDALTRFRQAMAAQPDNVDLYLAAGAMLVNAGRPAAAAAYYQAAAALIPNHPTIQSNLGVALRGAGQAAGAVTWYRRALRVGGPNAVLLSNLGSLLRENKDCAAQPALRLAVALSPDVAVGYGNLAALSYDDGDFLAAEAGCRRSLLLQPDNPELWAHLGAALQFQGRMDASRAAHRLSAALAPTDSEHWNRLGVTEQCLGVATSAFDRALRIAPDKRVAGWHRSLARLGVGDLAGGWRDYEDGLEHGLRGFITPLPIALWRGESLADRTVLVRREQGVGDEIMFSSCLPDLQGQAGLCVLECSPRLKALFQRSFPGVLVVETDGLPEALARLETLGLAPYRQTGLASLPLYFRRSLKDFPPGRAWGLRPDPVQIKAWRARLDAAGPGLKIGFSWRSRQVHGKDNHLYSQSLDDWREVFRAPGTAFVSLQYDPSEAELDAARAAAGPDVKILSFPELDLTNDLDGAAALTAACDMVLSAASTVAVMGGAVGRPTWILTTPADWRRHGTEGYPWLPTSTCFVRSWRQGWSRTLADVAARLRTPHSVV